MYALIQYLYAYISLVKNQNNVLSRVYIRKKHAIKMVKIGGRAGGGQRAPPIVRITPPNFFKIELFCFADQMYIDSRRIVLGC